VAKRAFEIAVMSGVVLCLLCSCVYPPTYTREVPERYRPVFDNWKTLGCTALDGYTDEEAYEMYMLDVASNHHNISAISSCLALRGWDYVPFLKRKLAEETETKRVYFIALLLNKMSGLCVNVTEDQELMQLLQVHAWSAQDPWWRNRLNNWIEMLSIPSRPEDCEALRNSYLRKLYPTQHPNP
jgi:hypothetical protein